MHLIILTQYYPPEIGAPQARLSDLASRFVRAGHKVTVLTAMPNYPTGKIHSGYGGLFRREQNDSISIIRSFIYPTQKVSILHRLANYFSFVLSSIIVGTFLLPSADYLMVESPPLFLGIAGYVLSRLKRVRLIFNVSDLWPDSAVHVGVLNEDSFAYKLSAWLEAFCYRKAWLVTGQSKTIVSDIQERFPDCRTFLLSNGVDLTRFGSNLYSDEARKRLFASSDTQEQCIALYAGLHGIAQGLDQILQAAGNIPDDKSIQIVLIGDGPEKQELLDLARDKGLTNVTFLDPCPASEVPALLASADIALIPLKTLIPGAVPSKLYEAMASARPVLLVAEGEPADIVGSSDAGLVVAPGDVISLASNLRTLSSQPELRERLGGNGRKAVEEHFDRSKIVQRLIDYLESNLHH